MRKFIYGLIALVIAATGVAYADSIITGSKPFTFIPGTTISSSQVNANFDYIINQTNTNAAKNGANSSITSLLGLTTPIATNSGGTNTWTATTIGGTANAITVTATTPIISSYSLTKGNIISLQPTSTNTGPVTLNVNTLGVKNILKNTATGLVAMTAGEFQIGQLYFIYYDGTNYIFTNVNEGFGNEVSMAAASTVDLGLFPTHSISLTAGGPITSFGTSASTSAPYYMIRCNASVNITLSAALLSPMYQTTGTRVCNNGDTMFLFYAGINLWLIETQSYNIAGMPTVQQFTSGASNYTRGNNVKYVKVRMCGGGGGGGAQATNDGITGGTSSFGSWTTIGGTGGQNGPAGALGPGGTGGANSTGTLVGRFDGEDGGQAANFTPTTGASAGGSAFFGGAGSYRDRSTGGAAKANTGGGGAPGGSAGSAGSFAGGGGGGGECVEFFVNAPGVTAYTVGAGGAGGAAGTIAGGAGAAGIIIVEEFY